MDKGKNVSVTLYKVQTMLNLNKAFAGGGGGEKVSDQETRSEEGKRDFSSLDLLQGAKDRSQ